MSRTKKFARRKCISLLAEPHPSWSCASPSLPAEHAVTSSAKTLTRSSGHGPISYKRVAKSESKASDDNFLTADLVVSGKALSSETVPTARKNLDRGGGGGDGSFAENENEGRATCKSRWKPHVTITDTQIKALSVVLNGSDDDIQRAVRDIASGVISTGCAFSSDSISLDGLGSTKRDKKWWKKLDDLRAYRELNGNCDVKVGEDQSLYHWTSRGREQLRLASERKVVEVARKSAILRKRATNIIPGIASSSKKRKDALERSLELSSKRRRGEMGSKTNANITGESRAEPHIEKIVVSSKRKAGDATKADTAIAQMGASIIDQIASESPKKRKISLFLSVSTEGKGDRHVAADFARVPKRERRFRSNLNELKAWRERHGNIDVPCEERRLYSWQLKMQRLLALHHAGRETSLKPEWVQELEDVGLANGRFAALGISTSECDSKDSLKLERVSSIAEQGLRERKWFTKLSELKEFKAKHGHIHPTARENRALYHWVLRQREKLSLDEEGGLSGLKAAWIAELKNIGIRSTSCSY